MVLAEFMKEGHLPIVSTIETTANPAMAWSGLFGRRRAKTLRNRARAFKHFRSWLLAAKGYPYPCSLTDALDYMEQRVGSDAGKTVIDSFAAAFSVIEELGGVKPEDMITKKRLFVESCKFWKVKAAKNAVAPKKAEIYFIHMLISLELFVTNPSVPDYDRGLGWLLLVMHWASMRLDDVVGIDATRFRHYFERCVDQDEDFGSGEACG